MSWRWPSWEVAAMGEKVSMRIAFGKALAAYGEQNKSVVVLDAGCIQELFD
jgi:transketolase C-terminal domain/subunit